MEFKCCAKNSREDKEIEKTYEFLKAISDANRLKIICILKNGPKCVCKIFSDWSAFRKNWPRIISRN